MAEKLLEVYEQYEMEVLSVRKGRGATILSTTEGVRILEPFRGSEVRLEQEYVLKQLLRDLGCDNLDFIIPNKEGQLLTSDKYRQPFVLKQHFEGEECDMHEISDIKRAVTALAKFHVCGRKAALEFPKAWEKNQKEKAQKRREEVRRAIAEGEEMERVAYLYELQPWALEELLNDQTEDVESADENVHPAETLYREKSNVKNLFERHNKELRKIHKYIERVKRKNDFETLFLRVFWDFYHQGTDCVEMFTKGFMSVPGVNESMMQERHYGICHGTYNQHNVILGNAFEAIVHFERFSKGNQLNDLYQFSRKVMEKNHFDYHLLKQILSTYGEIVPLTREDYQYLYILFSYPEKFWKIANGYYNTSKAFLSPKYVEKLEAVILQEEEKQHMLGQFEL